MNINQQTHCFLFTLTYIVLQFVPIPPVTIPCSNRCCVKKFMPLVLSWASTIHKLQGSTFGRTLPGEPPNPGIKLVIDLGDSKAEKRCPGLAYVAVSRGNSTGKGDVMKSAIFFIGKNFTKTRLMGMTLKNKGKEKCVLCARRDNWIAHLRNRVHGIDENIKRNAHHLIEWANTFRIDRMHFEENLCTWTD